MSKHVKHRDRLVGDAEFLPVLPALGLKPTLEPVFGLWGVSLHCAACRLSLRINLPLLQSSAHVKLGLAPH